MVFQFRNIETDLTAIPRADDAATATRGIHASTDDATGTTASTRGMDASTANDATATATTIVIPPADGIRIQ